MEVRLQLSDRLTIPLLAWFTYRADAPYTVHLAFHLHERPVPWTFARELRRRRIGPKQHGGERLRAETKGLWRAMETRAVIDQARGMVMALGECTPEQAWLILAQVTQHTNIKLHTVAAERVATTGGQPLWGPVRRELRGALSPLSGTTR